MSKFLDFIRDKIIDIRVENGLTTPSAKASTPPNWRGINALHSTAYAGASNKISLQDFNPVSGDAQANILPEIQTLRDRSQYLYNNSPIVSGIVNTIVNGVIGSGRRARPSIDRDVLGLTEQEAQEFENKAYHEIRYWSESVESDFYRQLVFYQQQRLALTTQLVRGDGFAILRYVESPFTPYGLKVQMIEADRVCNWNKQADGYVFAGGEEINADFVVGEGKSPIAVGDEMAGGIVYGKTGVRKGIFIQTPHPYSYIININNIVARWDYVPFYGEKTGRQNVLHLVDIARVGQTRGVPFISTIIDLIRQNDTYRDAEIQAAKLNAFLAGAITKAPPESIIGGYAGDEGDLLDNRPSIDLKTGALLDLAPYENFHTIEASRPSSQYETFTMANIKQMGMSKGLPFQTFLKDYNSSFTSAQGAKVDAQELFKIIGEQFDENFLQPIINCLYEEAVIKGRLKAKGFMKDPYIKSKYLGCYFVGPTGGLIDKIKEANAAMLRVKYGFSTYQHEANKLTGLDFKDICRLQAEERLIAESYNLSFSDEKSAMFDSSEREQNNKVNKETGVDEGSDNDGE
ncbi:MAG: phage portal protein [Candidatus Cloacimonetes bacterium]|nr:phage portal protein [Candidatus Cloacimonadota bacterium]